MAFQDEAKMHDRAFRITIRANSCTQVILDGEYPVQQPGALHQLEPLEPMANSGDGEGLRS